jgi:transposase
MGVPLQEVAGLMKVLYERVAGIDVHKDMIRVAIRSPGEKPWTRKTGILEFRTFYGVLQAMARELRRRGVTHGVMEASGVYTDPVYYALCEQDFEQVAVINPAHAKALKGHKTDPLTELPGGVPQVSGRRGALVATVADHDHRRRCAAGPVPSGDAAGRVA